MKVTMIRRREICAKLVCVLVIGPVLGGVFVEDFETGTKTTYAHATVQCSRGSWEMDEALLGKIENDKKNGSQAVRCRRGSFQMAFDKSNGVESVSLFHGMYGKDNANNVSWRLSISDNGGASWDRYISPLVEATNAWQAINFDNIDVPGWIRLRIEVFGGGDSKRVNFDDIEITDFRSSMLAFSPPDSMWFATRHGISSEAQAFTIKGMDLEADVVLTVPVGFEISDNDADGFGGSLVIENDGTLESLAYLRLCGSELGGFGGYVTATSAGAQTARLEVSGTVYHNLPPVFTNLPTVVTVEAYDKVSLSVHAYDRDGEIAGVTATSDQIAEADSFLSGAVAAPGWNGLWEWTPHQTGSNYVTFVAADNEGLNSSHTVLIEVTPDWSIALKPGTLALEDFDTMENGLEEQAFLPMGWLVAANSTVGSLSAFDTGKRQTDRRGGNSMGANAQQGIYNFGAGPGASASDRAIGFLCSGSGTKSGNLMARCRNVSGEPIDNLEISYAVEKYRCGTNPAGFAVKLYVSRDGLAWSELTEDWHTYFAPDDETAGYGEAPGATMNVVGRIPGSEILPYEAFYLCWSYSVASGSTTTSGQALAIDDVKIRARAGERTVFMLR